MIDTLIKSFVPVSENLTEGAFLSRVGSNEIINKLVSNYYILKNYFNFIDKDSGYRDETYYRLWKSPNNLATEFITIFKYFYEINMVFNEGYKVYSLGDSLDKLNFLWNIKNPDRRIISIPLSGLTFKNNLDICDLIEKYPDLLTNNPNFKMLVDDLNSGVRVVITDYLNSGKTLISLLNLFKHYQTNINNLHFIFIALIEQTDGEDVYEEDVEGGLTLTEINTNAILNKFGIIDTTDKIKFIAPEGILDRYYTNSEDISSLESRCVPKYNLRNWNSLPADVFIKNENDPYSKQPNYFNCNYNRILYYLSTSYFYDNFILQNINRQNIVFNNEFKGIIKKLIDEKTKIDEEQLKRSMSQSSRGGSSNLSNNIDPMKNKYLKYKSKYLKLKKQLENK